MALTDTFVKQVKHKGAEIGERYPDGGGMYLRVKAVGKYWRMDYRLDGKVKLLALGVYPAVTLAEARRRRDKARVSIAHGVDPVIAKREEKLAKGRAAANTFEVVAREWLKNTAKKRAAGTQTKITTWLEKDVFPYLGNWPISTIKAKDVLDKVGRRMEARGINESAHRVVQICSQVFRYAVAAGLVERDVTSDLRGALATIEKTHYAAITDPAQVGALLRSIHTYGGHLYTLTALKLSPLVFVRPGELRTAEWAEIDFDAAEWRIPGAKMKMKVDHIVPLSSQAVAYGDHLKCAVPTVADLGPHDDVREHLNDARLEFYSAEALRAFSRDTLPPGAFAELQNELHGGIKDEMRGAHPDGYRRVLSVVKTARLLPITDHALKERLSLLDKGGICHQLANDGKVRWVK
ncbi:integrase arm-type DNA-binding domain-containing protein [Variovorax paradoxus]|nr:integrase arm-type DNA-binding domain-containing protein [Variovorax paradoxus]